MGKLITITSGKGGVGKTTTAINLAAAINSFGKEVIIVDANLGTPNVGLHLGAPIVPISLNHALNGEVEIEEAIYQHESGTKIIPSSLSIGELKKIEHRKLKDLGKKLRKMADYIIYDSAAGLGEESIAALESADELIIVTNPEIPAVTDALKTYKLAEQMNKSVKGIIVTRHKNSKTEMPISNIRDMLELPILGVIPEEKRVQSALIQKEALVHAYPKCKASIEYKRIAANIIGHEGYNEKTSFFGRLFD